MKLIILLSLLYSTNSLACLKSSPSKSFRPKYARGFEIDYFENGIKRVRLNMAWQEKGSKTIYWLVPESVRMIASCRNQIDLPIRSYVSTSTTHLPSFEELGVIDKLIGFSGTKYITSKNILKRVESGKIKELGRPLNREYLLAKKPQMIMAFATTSPGAEGIDQLQKLKLPIVYNADFLENSALGRAEWIIFISAFFNLENQAKKFFSKVESNYFNLKKLINRKVLRPLVFIGSSYEGEWSSPAVNKEIVELVTDAGAKYIWEDEKSLFPIKKSFEQVYLAMKKAQFWLPQSNLKNLNKVDKRLKLSKLKVFNISKTVNSAGGNDYWSKAQTRPDLILRDLISIFHPKLLKEHTLHWYERIR